MIRLKNSADIESFYFRDLNPLVYLGTASDRYSGWLGQIYPEDLYRGKIKARRRKVGGRLFQEQVLPVESVREYFLHFPLLELDFTFYSPLVDSDMNPTGNYHVLRNYVRHMSAKDRLIVKVPREVFSRRIMQAGRYQENPTFLDPEVFRLQFYEPLLALADERLEGMIFEQEYQKSGQRPSKEEYSGDLDAFFNAIPADDRYHVEIRTEALLSRSLFRVLERHGIGHVLSHWTWLPSLRRQFDLSGGVFAGGSRSCTIRLMTPRGIRYEDAYAKAFPFDSVVEGMADGDMVADTVEIMKTAIERDTRVNVIINNRSGGNAPMIARGIADHFMAVFS